MIKFKTNHTGSETFHPELYKVRLHTNYTHHQFGGLCLQEFHVHLVSDSTGETVHHVAQACLSQFNGLPVTEHVWSLVRSREQVDNVLKGIAQFPGMVICTFADQEIKHYLKAACDKNKTPFISVLDPVFQGLSAYLGSATKHQPGRQHELNQDYFDKIAAVDFALHHDDGQHTRDLHDAEVILVGVSRTSKTPTCIYLSHRGIKAANVPIVPDIPLPDALFDCKDSLIVGLTTEPERLSQIRKSRLAFLSDGHTESYADIDNIREEVRKARQLFTKHGWPTIDVTRRSVEETAAMILQLYQRFQEKKESA